MGAALVGRGRSSSSAGLRQPLVWRRPATFVSGLMSLLVLLLIGLMTTAAAKAEYPDWNDYADVDVIELITEDEDGDLRETKVWFVLLGGDAYLRTSGSRWLKNLRRDPDLSIRIEGKLYEARAEEIQGDVIVEKVDIASRRKYGFMDGLIGLFRARKPDVLRVYPREAPRP